VEFEFKSPGFRDHALNPGHLNIIKKAKEEKEVWVLRCMLGG